MIYLLCFWAPIVLALYFLFGLYARHRIKENYWLKRWEGLVIVFLWPVLLVWGLLLEVWDWCEEYEG